MEKVVKSSYELLEETRAKVSIEVPFEEFKPEIDKAAKKIGKQVQIPGFRRGHVPTRVLEAQIGREAIVEQAANDAMDNYYTQALTENELVPLGSPAVDVVELPLDPGSETPFSFDVTVDIRPEIILPNPADITLEVDPASVNEDDVEKELTDLRERFASLKTADRAAADGDYVTIDLTATIAGEEVDSASGVSYRVGAGNMIDGLDEALTGHSAGEEVTFTSTLVGGEHEGEEAEVSVKIEKVQEPDLPEADDDFAQMASEFDTIEELRASLQEKAEKAAKEAQIAQARGKLLEHLREVVDVPLSDSLIDAQVEQHLQAEGKEGDDEHGEEIRDDLASSLRDQLMLDVLADKFGVQVQQDELLNFLVQQSQLYGMDANQFLSAVMQTGQVGAFSGELTRGKALISALRLATVVDTDGQDVDVIAVVGEKPEEENAEPDFSQERKRPAPKKSAAKKAAASTAKSEETDAAAETETAEAETVDAGDDDAFDPADAKIDDVMEYVEGQDAAEVQRVLEAEKAGKARKSLIAKLEKLI
ncbi:trigger factor [Actinobaculum suis]|uniref:Trigger factor n=1 Tax=Actinobaculum suis TaxID=1657 RepID=A0AAW9HW17_9ACTO|nr:trigger factor [Actinobaculum suis]MDY5153986.1 trigger factor [Actinobaculum suis]